MFVNVSNLGNKPKKCRKWLQSLLENSGTEGGLNNTIHNSCSVQNTRAFNTPFWYTIIIERHVGLANKSN